MNLTPCRRWLDPPPRSAPEDPSPTGSSNMNRTQSVNEKAWWSGDTLYFLKPGHNIPPAVPSSRHFVGGTWMGGVRRHTTRKLHHFHARLWACVSHYLFRVYSLEGGGAH